MPTQAFISLGSNLGDRRAHISSALAAIANLPNTTVLKTSDLIETDPVIPPTAPPDSGGGLYLNAVTVIETVLPRALLDSLLAIERAHGRDRSASQQWSPRALDLDLLLYGDSIISTPGLTIPHPRLHLRRFVLEPLAQLAPDLVVPGLNQSVAALLRAIPSHAQCGQ